MRKFSRKFGGSDTLTPRVPAKSKGKSRRQRSIDVHASLVAMRGRLLCLWLSAALCAACSAAVSFMPGLTPTDYRWGERLNVFATKMISANNRIPYDYAGMPFCAPSPVRAMAVADSKDGRLGLGQILQGERARLTAYNFAMLEDVPCALACVSSFSPASLKLLIARVSKAYRVRLMLDDLPVVVRGGRGAYQLGYPLGGLTEDAAVENGVRDKKTDSVVDVMNHLDFTVMYHVPDEYEAMGSSYLSKGNTTYRIVGFEVSARSLRDAKCEAHGESDTTGVIAHRSAPPSEEAGTMNLSVKRALASEEPAVNIPFTYSVKFVQSDVKWVTRFDPLLKVSVGHKKIQWFAIINSLMLTLLLTATLAVVLVRTLRRDCARFGIAASDLMDDLHDDFENDVGWRMLRGDVFRAPPAAGMLSVLCGSGAQLVIVAFVTLLFALFGILRPGRRGSLITALLAVWVLSSGIGGYVAARLHKAMGGVRWKLVTFGVALVLPGIAFSTFFVINVFMWAMGSIGAAPFLTMFLLLFLWLGVSVPLAFAGTYLGYRRKAYDFPVRTNQIPRPIPPQPAFLSSPAVHLAVGILPFGVAAIELRLILNSIYADEFYHFFGFLVAVFTLLAVTCAEVSVVLVFAKLSNSDYHWWWDSWFASGASGIYVWLYSLHYLATSPGADASNVVSNFLFIAYSFLSALSFTLLTGCVGFMSSLAFVRRIYNDSVDD